MGPGPDLGTRAHPRVEAVLAASRRCRSLGEWLSSTLAAVDRNLGFSRSSLMLALIAEPAHARRAFAGETRGLGPEILAEYFGNWADCDPLASTVAWDMFEAHGHASTAALYERLDHAGRRYVEEFLQPAGIADQLSLRLPGAGATDGYLTIHEPTRISGAQTALLSALASGLTTQLRRWLPKGLATGVSTREGQTSELVTFGFGNREIAAILNIGEDTVKKHLYRTMARLGLENRTQLAVTWMTGRVFELPGSGPQSASRPRPRARSARARAAPVGAGPAAPVRPRPARRTRRS